MAIGQALSICVRRYARFDGLAPRSEYWWWLLFVVVVGVVAAAFDALIGSVAWGTAWFLLTLLPTLAVSVRRLSDLGKPWPWLLLVLVPVVGWIALAVLLARPGATAPD